MFFARGTAIRNGGGGDADSPIPEPDDHDHFASSNLVLTAYLVMAKWYTNNGVPVKSNQSMRQTLKELEVGADEEQEGADWTQKFGCYDSELRQTYHVQHL